MRKYLEDKNHAVAPDTTACDGEYESAIHQNLVNK